MEKSTKEYRSLLMDNGDFVKSNEILQKGYETRNKIIDTKKEEWIHLKLKMEN